jgi:hypothetical protein
MYRATPLDGSECALVVVPPGNIAASPRGLTEDFAEKARIVPRKARKPRDHGMPAATCPNKAKIGSLSLNSVIAKSDEVLILLRKHKRGFYPQLNRVFP